MGYLFIGKNDISDLIIFNVGKTTGSSSGTLVALERAVAYLEILKIRMGARLSTQVDVPEALHAVPFPSMMLQTLVENAIKHGLEPRTAGGTVWIRARAADGEVAITVADDGDGIAAEHQKLVFEKFERLGRQGQGGTGLGLYLTRAIVEAHGGRCWVVSAPGRGSTFYFALPQETSLAIWRDESLV
mgnify:CR=1 FL=1